jgi:hypothetical protein
MGALVSNFDHTVNFWKIHPELKYPEAFKELRNRDRSRDKKDSSDIMWFVALCYDWESKWINEREDKRLYAVGQDFFQNVDFKDKVPESVVKTYLAFIDTPSKRLLREMYNKLDEKASFLARTKYREDTWEMIDKMLLSNEKIYKEVDRIKTLVDEENMGSTMKGGSQPSMLDTLDEDTK